MNGKKIILASASLSRLKLLSDLGYEARAYPTRVSEASSLKEPGSLTQTLALRKLKAFMKDHPSNQTDVIACDTVIWFDSKIIGKPKDKADAQRMLKSFSGRTHTVFTGYAFFHEGAIKSGFDTAEVTFRILADEEIKSYIASGEYEGAAGAYRVQGKAASFIQKIKGDPSTVVGVPVKLLGL